MVSQIIPNKLSQLFYRHGRFVARHPLPFLIAPMVTAGLLMIGMSQIEQRSDPEYLYVPTNAPSLDDRRYIEDTFLLDDSTRFTRLRVTRLDGFLQVHVQPATGSSIWNDVSFDEINTLNDFILNKTIELDGEMYRYADLCAQWNGNCEYSPILDIIGSNSVSSSVVNFPVHQSTQGTVYNIGADVGDVTTNSAGEITDAGAVVLSYFVRYQSDEDEARSDAWMNALRDELLDYSGSNIETSFWTALTLGQELENSVGSIVPLFSLAYNMIYVFATLSCMMSDWVRSKPWIAAAGLTAAALGIGSAIGLMAGCGVPFVSVVGSMPFLLIGEYFEQFVVPYDIHVLFIHKHLQYHPSE